MRRRSGSIILTVLLVFLLGCTAAADTSASYNPHTSQGMNPAGNVNGNTVVDRFPVYCFYSAFKRDYFWTASEEEMNQLLVSWNMGTDSYQYQGITGYVEQSPTDWNTPVYRFWNSKTMDHFYTIDETEKEQIIEDSDWGRDNYVYEGIAWYVPLISNTPVYRFFDVLNYNHFYTSDERVKESLNQAFLNGTGSYRFEGIAWYWYF